MRTDPGLRLEDHPVSGEGCVGQGNWRGRRVQLQRSSYPWGRADALGVRRGRSRLVDARIYPFAAHRIGLGRVVEVRPKAGT